MNSTRLLQRLFVLILATMQCHAQADEPLVIPLQGINRFFAIPAELDFDSGAANGDASILRIMPLYSYPSTETWKLVHLDIVTLADAPGGIPSAPGTPEPGTSTGSFGLADLMHASFYTPVHTERFIWGIGGIISAPTATSDELGSGKWAAGPALRATYRTSKWNLGMVAGQRWSFAGDSDRADVNQLMIRGAIRRPLNDDWFFVSAPLITANWNNKGQKWLVPVGGGIGRKFTLWSRPWAWSVQGYYNAIKPEAAPDWVVRFAVIAAIPLGSN